MTIQKFTICVLFLVLLFSIGAKSAQAACNSEYYVQVDSDTVNLWVSYSGIANPSQDHCELFTWYAYGYNIYSIASVTGSMGDCQQNAVNDLEWQFYVIMIYSGCWT